jgi:hypothetical protein
VLIDPAKDNPASFNPLEGDDPHLAWTTWSASSPASSNDTGDPASTTPSASPASTLMRRANPTLALVPPLLTDRQFRAEFTVDLDDPEGLLVRPDDPPMRAQVIGPVLARQRQFLLRDFVKHPIGGPTTSFNMGHVLDGRLLLCRLPKGVLGEDTVRVLGWASPRNVETSP